MNIIKKTMAIFVIGLFLVLGVAQAEASAAYRGYNTIGSYQQYGYQGGYTYEAGVAHGGQVSFNNPRYNYPSMPRAGGMFGSGSGWITGLRSPFYADVTPTHYSPFYRPTSGGHYGSGYGDYEYEETRIDIGFGWY